MPGIVKNKTYLGSLCVLHSLNYSLALIGGRGICGATRCPRGQPISSACIMTPFLANLTPNDPVFHYILYPMQWPIFFFKISNFLHASCTFQRLCQFSVEKGKFLLNFDKICTEWPLFWEIYTKKAQLFWIPHQWPPFSTKSYTECPLFSFFGRHIPATFIFECPLPPGHRPTSILAICWITKRVLFRNILSNLTVNYCTLKSSFNGHILS